MKIEFQKKQRTTIAFIAASVLTFICAALSISNGSSWMLRVLTQGSLCLTMLLNGVKCFIYRKQKALGSLLWLVSGFLLYVMIYTIYLGLKYNLF